jgi:hypothetical protein
MSEEHVIEIIQLLKAINYSLGALVGVVFVGLIASWRKP